MPTLKSVLSEKARKARTPEEQREWLLDWAARVGLKVEKRQTPLFTERPYPGQKFHG